MEFPKDGVFEGPKDLFEFLELLEFFERKHLGLDSETLVSHDVQFVNTSSTRVHQEVKICLHHKG